MAKATLTKTALPGAYASVTVNSADVTLTAADVANKNQFVASGRDLVVAFNSGAAPHTVTITSVADPRYGRTKDISAYSVGAGELAVFELKRPGYMQADGYIYLEADHAEIKFGVIPL